MPNLYYWNTSDDINHTHKRIEWAIENKYLISANIKITKKLLDTLNKNDIILTYEPKYHKKSKFINGEDGYCMQCKITRNDGLQAFTNIFELQDKPIIINTIEDYNKYNLFRHWFSTINHCKNNDENMKYLTTYFQNGFVIYLFPVKYISKIPKPISTNKKMQMQMKNNDNYENSNDTLLFYNGTVIKGFDKINDKEIENYIAKLI